MLKALSAALVAASLLAAPALVATSAEAAQPAAKIALTSKSTAKVVVVKHKRVAAHPRKHIKHVRHVGHWKWMKVHGKLVKIFVKKPATVVVRKHTNIIVKKPIAFRKSVTVVR
jgi:hypothetical protein